MQPQDHCWVMTRLMPQGTAADWMYKNPDGLPPLEKRLGVAWDVARAMRYLEESNPTVIHRDLKPTNVFVDEGGR